MHKLFPILFTLLLLFAGCASTSSSKGKPQFAPVNLRQATIYVFDDVPGLVGSKEVVVANGTPIGALSRRQYTWFFVSPGILDLTLQDQSRTRRTLASGQFVVRGGRSYYFRYTTVQRDRKAFVREGLTKVSGQITYPHDQGIFEVRESDGIALAGTHRLVDNFATAPIHRSSTRITVEYK